MYGDMCSSLPRVKMNREVHSPATCDHHTVSIRAILNSDEFGYVMHRLRGSFSDAWRPVLITPPRQDKQGIAFPGHRRSPHSFHPCHSEF